MTNRQIAYRKNRLMGMDQRNAALAAGYSKSTAYQSSRACEKAVDISDVLEQAGATNKVIAEALIKLALSATRPISCNVFIDQDGEVKTTAAGGKSIDFIEVPDNQSRLQALRQICELKRLTKSDKSGEDTPIETYFVELIRKYNGEMKKEGIDGVKITRVEHRALDQYVQK